MFSMTRKQAKHWIVILSVVSALALVGAALLLFWIGTFQGLVPVS